MISLDIYFDPICPWCYLGKTRLDRALEQKPDHPFKIAWHPFQLNPTMPPEGMGYLEYMKAKFHGDDGARKAISEANDLIGAEITDIDLTTLPFVPNTLDAHRVMHWAAVDECQTRVASNLFRAYFKDHADISDPDVLADIAQDSGMDRAATYRLLASDADIDSVQKRDSHARERGINAVPMFIIDNQHAVSGAQPPELWANVIDEINEQLQNQTETSAPPSQ